MPRQDRNPLAGRVRKFSLCNEAIADRPFAEQCAMARALGYDGFEIAPDTLFDDPRGITDRQLAGVQRTLADHGLIVTGLHWLLVKPTGLSITSPDDALRRTTRDVLFACIDLCAELGGKVLVHGSPKQREIAHGEDRAAAEARALDMFREIGAHAAARGVIHCLEPLRPTATNYVNTVVEAVAVVEQVGSPGFKTMLDTSSGAHAESLSMADTVRKWMPTGHLAHIQFNDANRMSPGLGDDKFGDVLRALKETGYDDAIAMEPFIFEPSPDAAAAYAIAYVKGLWEMLD